MFLHLSQPSCVRFTIREPTGVAMVYNSGKYVCMGGKSTIDMLTIARKVARKVQRIPEYSVRGQKGAIECADRSQSCSALYATRLPPAAPPGVR